MAEQDDLLDREEMIRQMSQPRRPPVGGIQAPVDPATMIEPAGPQVQNPVKPSAMDIYNERLNTGVVSADPAQRARELADAQGADAAAKAASAPVGPGASAGAYRSKLGGFDPNKMTAEHAAKSPKYAFAMLAQDYPDTPEGLIAMSQDPRFAAAGFKLQGKDKILAPDPERGGMMGTVDVGNSFSVGGGKGWQWGAEPHADQAGAAAQQAAMGAMGGGGVGASSAQQGMKGFMPTDNDFLAKLQAQIAELLGGPGALDREALLKMIGGQ